MPAVGGAEAFGLGHAGRNIESRHPWKNQDRKQGGISPLLFLLGDDTMLSVNRISVVIYIDRTL